MLGSSEEHTALARVLAQLAEVEEQCDSVHVDQSDADFFIFAELVHEYIGLVQAVKVRTFKYVVVTARDWIEK